MRRCCQRKMYRICWHFWLPAREVRSEDSYRDFGIDSIEFWYGSKCASYSGTIGECRERAAELADVQRELLGAEVFDPGSSEHGQCGLARAQVGLSDDGRRKI